MSNIVCNLHLINYIFYKYVLKHIIIYLHIGGMSVQKIRYSKC